MIMDEVESIFEDGKVKILLQQDAELFTQGGFGTPLNDDSGIVLAPWETLHLLDNKRIKVIDGETEEALDFQTLFRRFRNKDVEIWTKYLIFKDLRKRGYVVREGTGWGITFRVYLRGTYGKKVAKYLLFIVSEWNAVPIGKIREVLRLVQGMKRELIIVVIDNRGEIVYYSLSTLNL